MIVTILAGRDKYNLITVYMKTDHKLTNLFMSLVQSKTY